MLHERRKVLAERDAAEARGVDLRTTTFDAHSRLRILYAFQVAGRIGQRYRTAADAAQRLMLVQLGLPALFSGTMKRADDFEACNERCADSRFPTWIEAAHYGLSNTHGCEVEAFAEIVNFELRNERITYELINGEMIDYDSRAMHTEVVVPTITLLGGRPDWANVERSYHEAVRETDPKDAINDAARALEQALKLVGATGDSLGPLISDAAKRGLIAPYDKALLTWVSADRSQRGSAHDESAVGAPTHADAKLTVHVVGAIILRLAELFPATD
jgi:hypothetical protein